MPMEQSTKLRLLWSIQLCLYRFVDLLNVIETFGNDTDVFQHLLLHWM